MYAIACAFRRGVALVGEFFYWALLTLSWDPLLGTGVYREMASNKAVIMKEAVVWP